MGGAGARTRGLALAALALFASALTACASAEPAAPAPTPTPSYSSSYLTPAPYDLAPLTGEVVEAGSLTNPSLAAKIDNHELARPQLGLERTDIVFEELVEGGLTRYVAVWHSDIPDEIGPVRSIRPMDPDIVSPLGGIIAYSGGQYRFVVLMQQTVVYNAIHGAADTADLMFRTSTKSSPHNVLVKAKTLVSRHTEISAPAQQFAFAPDVAASSAVVEGAPAPAFTARFSDAASPSWKYDETSQLWKRSQLGVVDRDANGDQLSAANVVVVSVPISYGLGVPKTELIGGGDAWVFSGGQSLAVRWSKSSQTAPIVLTDLNGFVVRLAPGNTWIELMPNSGKLTITAPSGS